MSCSRGLRLKYTRKLRDLPASASQVLGLKACATTARHTAVFFLLWDLPFFYGCVSFYTVCVSSLTQVTSPEISEVNTTKMEKY